MLQILFGSLLLSVVHALIPNHWIPLVAIGKAEKWSKRETISATIITGLAHTSSTVLVGIAIGFAGYKLSASYDLITTLIAPLVLVTIGLVYLIIDFVKLHRHEHSFVARASGLSKSRWGLILTLSIAMFFSPCIELEAFFFQAGTLGWPGIIVVSVIYTITTVTFMAVFVSLGTRGIEKLNWHFLEHHEKRVTGLVLIILGILVYFVRF